MPTEVLLSGAAELKTKQFRLIRLENGLVAMLVSTAPAAPVTSTPKSNHKSFKRPSTYRFASDGVEQQFVGPALIGRTGSLTPKQTQRRSARSTRTSSDLEGSTNNPSVVPSSPTGGASATVGQLPRHDAMGSSAAYGGSEGGGTSIRNFSRKSSNLPQRVSSKQLLTSQSGDITEDEGVDETSSVDEEDLEDLKLGSFLGARSSTKKRKSSILTRYSVTARLKGAQGERLSKIQEPMSLLDEDDFFEPIPAQAAPVVDAGHGKVPVAVRLSRPGSTFDQALMRQMAAIPVPPSPVAASNPGTAATSPVPSPTHAAVKKTSFGSTGAGGPLLTSPTHECCATATVDLSPASVAGSTAASMRAAERRKSSKPPRTSRASVLFEQLAQEMGSESTVAAVAIAVDVGSFSTPPGLDGLAHYLEHMLFMGSTKYPAENQFDAVLSRAGGFSNAYTDTEQTVYHFSCPLATLAPALDVFSQFFVSPLLSFESAERELNLIESEFALRLNIDACRLQEIWRETSTPGSKFSKFACGNIETLKTGPKEENLDVNAALRRFFNDHYSASNIRICVVSNETLDAMEVLVRKCFAGLKPGPKPSAKSNGTSIPLSLPWSDTAVLGKVFRVIPRHDIHELKLTWQLPSQLTSYKSKPCEYIAHLLGHEGKGSILAEAKARGWATEIIAGIPPDDGFAHNTSCSLFSVTVSLTSSGLREWIFVAGLIFEFLGLMRFKGPQEWVFRELRDVAAAQQRYHEEPDGTWLAQCLSVRMLPSSGLDLSHVLDGPRLFLEWDPKAITDVVNRMTPSGVRVDLSSSKFASVHKQQLQMRQPSKFSSRSLLRPGNAAKLLGKNKKAAVDVEVRALVAGERPAGDRAPQLERHTKAEYWVDPLPPVVLESWDALLKQTTSIAYLVHEEESSTSLLASMDLGTELDFPSPNPFVCTDFNLVEKPALSTTIQPYADMIGQDVTMKSFPSWWGGHLLTPKACAGRIASIVQRDKGEFFALIVFRPTQERAWVPLSLVDVRPAHLAHDDDEEEDLAHHESLPSISSSARLGISEPQMSNLTRRLDFPRIPTPGSLGAPSLIPESDEMCRVWLFNDVVRFPVPRVEIHLSIFTPAAAESAMAAAMADMFAVLVFEELNQTSFMAFLCELDFQIEVMGGAGLQLHFSGFSHRMHDLLRMVLEVLVNFSSKSEEVLDVPLFYAHIDALAADYARATSRFRSSSQVSSVMFDLLSVGLWSPRAKLKAIRKITPGHMKEFTQRLFQECRVEGLIQGNADDASASRLHATVASVLGARSKPFRGGLRLGCVKIPPVGPNGGLAPVAGALHILEAIESTGHSAELYFGIGPENPESRVLASVIEQLMREPLYADLRTRQQLGYAVKCGVRSVGGDLGFVVEITSNSHGPDVLASDVDEFLTRFRTETLLGLTDDDFEANLCGLIAQLVEPTRSLGEAAAAHWATILSRTFYGTPLAWNGRISDAQLLARIATRENVLKAFDAWLNPASPTRRRVSIYVVGYGYKFVERLLAAVRRAEAAQQANASYIAAHRNSSYSPAHSVRSMAPPSASLPPASAPIVGAKGFRDVSTDTTNTEVKAEGGPVAIVRAGTSILEQVIESDPVSTSETPTKRKSFFTSSQAGGGSSRRCVIS